MTSLICFSKGISSVTMGWLLRYMGNWETWKMCKRLNGQEKWWNFGFAPKTSGSVWEKTVVYQKCIFFLLVAIFVVSMSKRAVKVECRSTRGKSATVLPSNDTEGYKENNSSVWSHLISKCLTHIQLFFNSKLVLQSSSTAALTVQDSSCIYQKWTAASSWKVCGFSECTSM